MGPALHAIVVTLVMVDAMLIAFGINQLLFGRRSA